MMKQYGNDSFYATILDAMMDLVRVVDREGNVVLANQSLKNAIIAMEQSIPTDLIVTDLYDSWESLKEILGERAKEDLLDELFKRFCIGK